MAATKCDSMTLTLGPWLGLPAVPAVTLYRQEDPALSLAAGLTSSQVVEKLRALSLWLSLQYLGHDGIVQRIKHASQLSQRLLENLKNQDFIRTSVEDEFSCPVVVFKFSPEKSHIDQMLYAAQSSAVTGNERDICDTFNQWLGEQLAQLVPASGVDLVDLEDEGTCVRFSPLMTSAVLGTEVQDVDQLMDCLKMKVPVLTCTLQLREEFEQEVKRTVGLSYVEDFTWPGLGVVRYKGQNEETPEKDSEKINSGLLKKLNELESDLLFSSGPEFGAEKNCIYIGMVTEDLDVSELVETIAASGREIEENSRLLENMTEVVRKGILDAQVQLQKANEERLLEEGLLRQIPVVGSVVNWFSPFHASPKGQTFNLTAGSLESTETTYKSKAQATGITPPPTPTSSRAKQKFPDLQDVTSNNKDRAEPTQTMPARGRKSKAAGPAVEPTLVDAEMEESSGDSGDHETFDSPCTPFKLSGECTQYPNELDEPHPGIGKAEHINRNTVSFLNHEHRLLFHPVTGSLVFLCYLVPRLWKEFSSVGVPLQSYFSQPFKVGEQIITQTTTLYNTKIADRPVTSLEMSAILGHCCQLLIGVVIGSSTKISARSEQIKKRLRALMVTLGRDTDYDFANALQLYPPTAAIDWINMQPWVGSFVALFFLIKFESPMKELTDQIRIVARGARLTTYTRIRQYLEQCMDATIALPLVVHEIDAFLKVERELQNAHGQCFEFLGALRHPDAGRLAPRNFPNLLSATRFWSRRERTTRSAFKAPVIQPGATISEPLLAWARRRGITRVGTRTRPRKKVLLMIGVTGYAEEK